MNYFSIVYSIIFLLFPFVSFAQYQQEKTIPVSILVENSVYTKAVDNATVSIAIKDYFDNGNVFTEKIKETKTNAEGYVVVDLLPNKNYTVTVFREGFFSLLTVLNTTYYSRINKNKIKISLRPKNLLTVMGKVTFEGKQSIKGKVFLINKRTLAKQSVEIAPNGSYKIQGIEGEKYELQLSIKNLLDTLVGIDTLPKKIHLGTPSFVLNIPLQKKNSPRKIYIKNDSIILKKIQFIAKTTAISDTKWLDTLSQKLLANPRLKIKLNIHTDSKKSHRFNRILAEKRAEILHKELIIRHIPNSQFELVAKGEEELLYPCANCKKQSQNNRIVLIVKEGRLSL